MNKYDCIDAAAKEERRREGGRRGREGERREGERGGKEGERREGGRGVHDLYSRLGPKCGCP